MKRTFDLVFSIVGIILLFPFFIIIYILIPVGSKGSSVYVQRRVGRHGIEFLLYKFRTMEANSSADGLLTVGTKDIRITRIGRFLRKYKIDELLQLFNVLEGSMSFVGPRPEVKKYVNYYTEEQMKVLSIKPGITDYASIEFSNESEILGKAENPQREYVELIMPKKLKLNLKYLEEQNLYTDIKIIFLTLLKISKS
ncbi:MAG TPA: sugar transferase [Flavobacteriales bacterium]|nr:sugar transferase [Flavobacteriales bacterium]